MIRALSNPSPSLGCSLLRLGAAIGVGLGGVDSASSGRRFSPKVVLALGRDGAHIEQQQQHRHSSTATAGMSSGDDWKGEWKWKNEQGLLLSPSDRRMYRQLKLDNGLRVLLVTDPHSKKASAAMAVDVGASSDPRWASGVAHFTEHMCFLGSEKYPKENAYKAFLSKNGGRSNASTSMDATIYKFQVLADALEPTLDIFSQFFVAPSFSEGATERELKAVDSEDSKNRTNDERRVLQVSKALLDQTHPYTKYSTGNLKTLKEDLPEDHPGPRQELLEFHQLHYHSENMGLSVLGNQPLDELEAMVRSKFLDVKAFGEGKILGPNSPLVGRSAEDADVVDPFTENPLPRLVDLEPLRELKRLVIQWPCPPVELLESSPTTLMSHLLGHEGPGSVFAVLQDKGWVRSLSSGLRTSQQDFALFQVTMNLTDAGEEHREEIARLVHAYTALLRNLSEEEAQRLYREKTDISAMKFQFQQEENPFDFTSRMSRRLQLYPEDEVLSKGALQTKTLDFATFQRFTEFLRPHNTLTWRVSKSGKGGQSAAEGRQQAEPQGGAGLDAPFAEPNRTERWYGVPYRTTSIEDESLRVWTEAAEGGQGQGQEGDGRREKEGEEEEDLVKLLRIPGPNIYIADDFSLACEAEAEGEVEAEEAGGAGAGVGIGDASAGGYFAGAKHEPPSMLSGGEEGQVWHKIDSHFKQPRTNVGLLLVSPAVRESARSRAGLQILLDILQTILNQATYDAALAGLHYGLGSHPHGVLLQVGGFSQKQEPLLRKLLEAFLDPVSAAGGMDKFREHFTTAKEAVIKRHVNFALTRPDDLAAYYARLLLEGDKSTVDETKAAAEAAEVQDVLDIHSNVVAKAYPSALLHGNIDEAQAKSMWTAVRESLSKAKVDPLPEADFPQVKIGVLKTDDPSLAGSGLTISAKAGNDAEENSACFSYWSLGEKTRKNRAVLLLLSQLMREPCFSTLRTQQQLGYIVSSGIENMGRGGKMTGFSIRVLSKNTAPEEMSRRITQFVTDFRQTVESMPEEELQRHVESLVVKQREPPKRLGEEYMALWREIDKAQWEWDSADVVISELGKATKEDLLAVLDDKMLQGGADKRRVDVHVYGHAHVDSMPVLTGQEEGGEGGGRVITPAEIPAFRDGLEMVGTSTPLHAAHRRGE